VENSEEEVEEYEDDADRGFAEGAGARAAAESHP
jgi:hypothetical protein